MQNNSKRLGIVIAVEQEIKLILKFSLWEVYEE
mgnify:CR=1 FL=1